MTGAASGQREWLTKAKGSETPQLVWDAPSSVRGERGERRARRLMGQS